MIGLQDVNVQKMKDAPKPTTKREIRSFLGLAGYYQDFIANFAAIAPLFPILHVRVSLTRLCGVNLRNDLTIH